MENEHGVIDTSGEMEKPHHIDENDPDAPKPVDFDEPPTDEGDDGESVVAAKFAAGSAKVTKMDEAGTVGDDTPMFDKDGFLVDPEKEPKFEHEHGGDTLAGGQMTPESIKEGAQGEPPNDEDIDYAWEIDKAIIEGHVETPEEIDEEWENLPHDSEDEETFESLELGDDGYYHYIIEDSTDEEEAETGAAVEDEKEIDREEVEPGTAAAAGEKEIGGEEEETGGEIKETGGVKEDEKGMTEETEEDSSEPPYKR